MDELTQELDELAEEYAILDELHQRALLELQKYSESVKFGATFEFEDGNQMFIPVFGITSGLKANGQIPTGYTLNFNESTMVEWIFQADTAVGKNRK